MERITQDKVPVAPALSMIFMVQSIERIGDHAKNIAEFVVHIVDGIDLRYQGSRSKNLRPGTGLLPARARPPLQRKNSVASPRKMKKPMLSVMKVSSTDEPIAGSRPSRCRRQRNRHRRSARRAAGSASSPASWSGRAATPSACTGRATRRPGPAMPPQTRPFRPAIASSLSNSRARVGRGDLAQRQRAHDQGHGLVAGVAGDAGHDRHQRGQRDHASRSCPRTRRSRARRRTRCTG